MQVIIQKIANDVNFVGSMVGSVYETSVYDEKDYFGILGCIFCAVFSRDDVSISFVEE